VAAPAIPFKPRNRPPTSARQAFPLQGGLQGMFERAQALLAEPFKGLTTDGNAIPGLYSIHKTGVSTQPLVDAAEAYLAALSSAQRERACFAVDSDEWRKWSNIHPWLMRHGQGLVDLSDSQREAALGLLRATLSASGFELARNIMRLNEYIGELTGGKWEEYGEWYYWMSLFGTPSTVEPWGWQIDGHHLIVNCFVLGDQITITPAFMGSEPVSADTGKWAGIRVFQDEEAKGYAVMASFTADQKAKATIGMKLPFDGTIAAFKDNLVVPNEGVNYKDMAPGQQAKLVSLLETYVARMRPGHAEVWLEQIKKHLPHTYFSWIGECNEVDPFYYRVVSPVIMIEFDHQPGVALDNDEPSRHHTHTIIRTPNGNDYGKDLLRLHYETHPHHMKS